MKPTVKKSRPSVGKERVKRKTRAELNLEGRDRKRQKKHKGHAAGQRTNPASEQIDKRANTGNRDARIGSKKPIPLLTGTETAKNSTEQIEPLSTTKMSSKDELAQLENSEQLDVLLDRLEQGETLNAEDKHWLDTTLDRIEELMLTLGIDMDEVEDDEKQEDMYRLLKGQ